MKRRKVLQNLLGGVALCAAPQVALAADSPLRIATLPVDPAACCYYAKELGYFESAGLAANVQILQSGSAIAAAVVGGSIDIGWSAPISVAAAHLRGLPITIVAAGGLYVSHRPTTGVIVAKNSPLRTAHDLEGKTLAVEILRGAGQLSTQLWMTTNGADASKLNVIEMPFPQMATALGQARIDAAFSAEPYITEGGQSCRFFADTFASIAPRFCLGVWVSTPQWVNDHRDAIIKFNKVMAKAGSWANTHHAQSARILSKYTGLELSVAQTMTRVTYGTSLLASEVQPTIDLGVRDGILASHVTAEELITAT